MKTEHKDAIRESNRRRQGCKRCGGENVTFVYGDKVGGIDCIVYKYCNGCGNADPTKKMKP